MVIGDQSAFAHLKNKAMFTYLYRYTDGLGASTIHQRDQTATVPTRHQEGQ